MRRTLVEREPIEDGEGAEVRVSLEGKLDLSTGTNLARSSGRIVVQKVAGK